MTGRKIGIKQTIRSKKFARIFTACAFLLVIFLPEILALGYRALYGGIETYHRVGIQIPTGWLATTSDKALIVWRLPRFYMFLKSSPTIVFLPLVLPGNFVFEKDTQYDAWETTEIESLSRDGFEFVGRRRLSSAQQEGYCLEGVHSEEETQLESRCFLPAERLYVNFVGNKKYATDFYAIIDRLVRTESSN